MKKNEYILEYDMVFATILSVVLLVIPILLCFLLPSDFIVDDFADNVINGTLVSDWFFLILLILWCVLHEVIHGLAYRVMGVKGKNIVFGGYLEKGVFYCKCKEYINKKSIMVSLLAPFILIGILTFILGYVVKSSLLVKLSVCNISGAAADLMMFVFFLRQDDDVEFKELGFSSPFCLRTKKNLENKKYLGIKSIRKVKDAKETREGEEKKVTISKGTWIFLAVVMVILVVSIILDMIG